MARILNWTKIDRKKYQNQADESVTLRLLNTTETRQEIPSHTGWAIVIESDGDIISVVREDIDGYNAARRASAAWMRSHPFAATVVTE